MKLLTEIQEYIEKLINEGDYHPDDQYHFLKNPRGYWKDAHWDYRSLLEWGSPGSSFELPRSPRNQEEDKRKIVADFYYTKDKWVVNAMVCEGEETLDETMFVLKSPVSQEKINKLLEKVENKFQSLMENKTTNPLICESFSFDKFMVDIINKEDKAKELMKRDAEGYENNHLRKRTGKDGLY